MSVNSRFKSQLPFTIHLLGHRITFGTRSVGDIPVEFDGSFDRDLFRTAFKDWKGRKGIWIEGPDERENLDLIESRMLRPDLIRHFLDFFIAIPIGMRLLILDEAKDLSRFPGRVMAITQLLLTWDALSHWERQASGKLKLSISCAAYRSRLAKHELNPRTITYWSVHWCLCSSNVSDLSGCCGPHKKLGAKTLFNYYPFFASEGFSELMT